MKKVLFISRSLGNAGVPTALVNFVNLIDYNEWEVTIGLENSDDKFQLPRLNKNVNCVFYNKEKRKIEDIINRIQNRIKNKVLFKPLWKFLNQILKIIEVRNFKKSFPNRFDIAMAFHQGKASKYVVKYVKSDKKILWYHASRIMPDCREKYFKKADVIVSTSPGTTNVLLENWKKIKKDKIVLIPICLDYELIKKLSHKKVDLHYKKPILLTIGRLCPDKGFDLLLDTAQQLLNGGFDFSWLIIGDGELHEEIDHKIIINKLANNVFLLGSKENPYPYLKQCDLYVSTSLFEAYGISITEAIILKKYIIATKTSGAIFQLSNNNASKLVNSDAVEMAKAIQEYFVTIKDKNNIIFADYNNFRLGTVKEYLKLFS